MYSTKENTRVPDKGKSHNRKTSAQMTQPSQMMVRAKLEVEDLFDHDEREADRMANAIVSGSRIIRAIKKSSPRGGIAMPANMAEQLKQTQGKGMAMPQGLRNMMESGFGRDFSNVRLHTDRQAVEMNRAIRSRAFTHGNDIYFNNGQYAPESAAGQQLIAHELTHVIQEGTTAVKQKGKQYIESNVQEMGSHLKANIKDSAKGFVESSRDVLEDLKEKGSDLKSKVGKELKGAEKSAKKAWENLKEKGGDLGSEIEDRVNGFVESSKDMWDHLKERGSDLEAKAGKEKGVVEVLESIEREGGGSRTGKGSDDIERQAIEVLESIERKGDNRKSRDKRPKNNSNGAQEFWENLREMNRQHKKDTAHTPDAPVAKSGDIRNIQEMSKAPELLQNNGCGLTSRTCGNFHIVVLVIKSPSAIETPPLPVACPRINLTLIL